VQFTSNVRPVAPTSPHLRALLISFEHDEVCV
jgi:hypothetical protein